MGVLGFKKKSEVPQELPDLISDEIERETSSKIAESSIPDVPKEQVAPQQPQESSTKNISDYHAGSSEVDAIRQGIQENIGQAQHQPQPQPQPTQTQNENEIIVSHPAQEFSFPRKEKSFFNELQENLKQGMSEDKLESWYESKLSSKDMVEEMRSYWEKQKVPSIMEELGKTFQVQIYEKMNSLQELERDWQHMYFKLIEKEEEIKDAEKELKESLSQFIKICKHKKESLENENQEKEVKEN